MANCEYCGQKTGWFSGSHEACVTLAHDGISEIKFKIFDAVDKVSKGIDVAIQPDIAKTITANRVPADTANTAILTSWSEAVSALAIQEPLSPIKYNSLRAIYTQLGFTDQQLKSSEGFKASSLSCVLWSIVNNEPDGYSNAVVSRNPFQLKSHEVPIAFFGSVTYSEETSTKSRVGGYRGLSVRVLPGVYSHFGGFAGHTVETVAMTEIDYGGLLLTTESLYFGGDHTTFCIPLKSVISFHPQPDGLGFARNSGHGKPEAFGVLLPDTSGNPIPAPACVGWFLFNAAHFLATKE